MIPVDQAHYLPEDPLGDCLAACVASILELPLDQVPDTLRPVLEGTAPPGYSYLDAMWDWWVDSGIVPRWTFYGRMGPRFYAAPRHVHPGYWIAGVRSKVAQQPGSLHAIVMFNDAPAHDPQPLNRQEPHASAPYRYAAELWFEAWDPALALGLSGDPVGESA